MTLPLDQVWFWILIFLMSPFITMTILYPLDLAADTIVGVAEALSPHGGDQE